MESIEGKIIITLFIMWFITHFAANPDSKFSEWGKKKYGDYTRFLINIACIYLVPIAIVILYWIWKY